MLTCLGHVIHLNRDRMLASAAAHTTVPMKPPMKPSQVFLGDSAINGVRPKKYPAAGEGAVICWVSRGQLSWWCASTHAAVESQQHMHGSIRASLFEQCRQINVTPQLHHHALGAAAQSYSRRLSS